MKNQRVEMSMIFSLYIIIRLESPRRKLLEQPTTQRLTMPSFDLAISTFYLLFLHEPFHLKTVVSSSPMYAKSKEYGEHDLQSLYHHQLGNAPSEALRATYSPTIDIAQLRTSFIDFLAALLHLITTNSSTTNAPKR